MNSEIIRFVASRIATRTFWMLLITSLLGMLMYELRSNFRDQVFQQAVGYMKSRGWQGWRGTCN